MSDNELLLQRRFWDQEISRFDAIYSHEKNSVGNFLDRVFRWDMVGRFNYTMAHSVPIVGRSFLDVGCGTGRYALEYVARGAKKVVGIDISPNMVDTCQERARDAKAEDRTEFLQTDLLAYQPREPFDVCIGIGLFDYVRDALPVIRKMRECVGDRAIMSFPKLWTWRAPVRKVRLYLKSCDVFFYTKQAIANLLRHAGFSRFSLEEVGQLYCVTAYAG